MAYSKQARTSRWISAGLLALLSAVGLYLWTLGLRWPTLDALPVWGFEAAYGAIAGLFHFLLWPLWHGRLPHASPASAPTR